jgi:hypothetical protein
MLQDIPGKLESVAGRRGHVVGMGGPHTALPTVVAILDVDSRKKMRYAKKPTAGFLALCWSALCLIRLAPAGLATRRSTVRPRLFTQEVASW